MSDSNSSGVVIDSCFWIANQGVEIPKDPKQLSFPGAIADRVFSGESLVQEIQFALFIIPRSVYPGDGFEDAGLFVVLAQRTPQCEQFLEIAKRFLLMSELRVDRSEPKSHASFAT